MALEIFRRIGSVFVDTDKANESLKKTDKSAEGVGTKLLGAVKSAGKFAIGVAGAAAAAGGAIVALAENTREYRTEQGKLQAAFETSGFAAGEARQTYEALNGVLGDSGQAVEASNHLAKLCTNAAELADWTTICTGVYATFGDSLPIEGLTEAANETAKTGALTGGLADALNWAGVNEEDFQTKLDACNSERERQALITETLTGLYTDSAEAYREVNGEVIAANEAQDKLTSALATVGGAVEPIITQGKLLIAEVLERASPAIQALGSVVIPFLVNAITGLIGWFDSLISKLSSSGVSFQSVMTIVQTLFSQTMTVLQGIWTSIGQPVWNFIAQAINLVAGYFQERMPQIQAFVRTAFSDIQQLWTNHLQPTLKAIGDFIQNVLAPAFKFVFDMVITPVVDTAFKAVKQMWTGTLKPVFQGILDFIQGVFTLNFKKAFSGLVTAVQGIMNGMKTAVKTPINAVISVINSFIRGINKLKIPDWVPGVGGKGINISQIPYLYKGGVLERGQVGLLEGSGAEAVVPLEHNKKWIQAVANDMEGIMGVGSSAEIVAVLLDILALLEKLAQMGIYLDTGALVGGLAKPLDRKLGQIQARKART